MNTGMLKITVASRTNKSGVNGWYSTKWTLTRDAERLCF
jgi:hypothetical protein